jgi:hypothetical protein
MFLRPHYRLRNGRREAYWALVESYRAERGPRQRTVAYLGLMDEAGRLGVEQAADLHPPSRQRDLFLESRTEPRFVEIDRTRVRVENCRQFGGPWLALELVKQLELDAFLKRRLPAGQEHVSWSLTALILVIARLCEPSSELHLAEHFYRQSALGELLGVPADKVDGNRLYRGLDELLPHKPALEAFLKQRFGELFAIEYDLLLYDVTSTYFEGQASANPLAKRGYSRDHRPDCKQVCIGLVVTRCGLPLGYQVFAGNRHDSTTLEEIVETMEARYGQAQRIWVLDRGLVSQDNLDFLKAGQRQYLVGTPKSQLKRFEQQLAAQDWRAIREGLEVKLCQCPDGTTETYILCRSRDRHEKEQAMHARFEKRIEERLVAASRVAPKRGPRAGAHSGLLSGLRALEVPGATLPESWARKRTAARAGGTQRTACGRRRFTYERRSRNPLTLRDSTQRPSENPPGTARFETARPLILDRIVVEKRRSPTLGRKHLHQTLGKLG